MEFRLLGPLEVERDGESVGLGGPREKAVLGALLLRANQFASVGYLVDAVWDSAPASPETNLRTYVAGLRRRLGPGSDGTDRLLTRNGGYVFVAARGELDVAVFEDLVDRGERALAEDDTRTAAQLFESALARWRGEPLDGCRVGPGLRADMARLRERRLRALEQYATARIRLGRRGAAIGDLRELVVEHPLREELWAQLMIALCRSGRRAEALEVFATARNGFVEELGVEPGPRLRTLHSEILRDDQDVAVGPRMAAEPAVEPAQLPADLSTFTGRDDELDRLLGLLTDGSSTAVLISAIDGMAGIGKTALAVHVAHRLASRFPDGQLFVDLHGHTHGIEQTTPAKALDQLLRALGVPGEMVPDEAEPAAALYRSRIAGRRILIVLDNAADEDQIEPLLPGAPGCGVLVTSRRRLTGLDHAVPLTLDVLPVPEAVALFTDITGQQGDDEAVGDIVRLCGQLPLAIRIAAARLRARSSWTPAHLVDRLRDQRRRLGELSTGQRGVAAAINLSYGQLPPDQQRMFRLLGLHPGADIDVAAAAALTGIDAMDAEDVLETLLDAHLLHQRHPGRYQFHDLVRVHAAQTCEQQDPEPARRAALTRLFDHYADMATAAMDMAYPNDIPRRPRRPRPAAAPADKTQATTWLDVEHVNLLDIAIHTAEHGWDRYTMHLSTTLSQHLETRAHLIAAERLHTDAVAAARRLGDQVGELNALNAAGLVQRLRGRHGQALDNYAQALALADGLSHRHGELDAMRGVGNSHHMRGNFTQAVDYYQRALALARDIGDHGNEADVLRGLGDIDRLRGESDAAIGHYQEALRIAIKHDDRTRELHVLFGIGNVHYTRGDHGLAADHYERCLRLARATGDRKGELYALLGHGDVHRLQGRPVDARDCYLEVMRLTENMGNRNYQFEALHALGHVYLLTGDADLALTHQQDALDLACELEQLSDQARALDGVARAHHVLGQAEQARSHWTRCLTLLDELRLTEIEDVNADQVRAHLAEDSGT